MKVSDLEEHRAWRLGKWVLFNGDNTALGFHLFYDGKEIEMAQSLTLMIDVNEPIRIKVEALIPPYSWEEEI